MIKLINFNISNQERQTQAFSDRAATSDVQSWDSEGCLKIQGQNEETEPTKATASHFCLGMVVHAVLFFASLKQGGKKIYRIISHWLKIKAILNIW